MTAAVTLPTPDLPRLRQVLDHIDAHPEQHEQRGYASLCGTAHCVAGWTLVFAGHEVTTRTDYVFGPDGEFVPIDMLAMRLLGITQDEAWDDHGLFHPLSTRADIQRAAEGIAARAGERL